MGACLKLSHRAFSSTFQKRPCHLEILLAAMLLAYLRMGDLHIRALLEYGHRSKSHFILKMSYHVLIIVQSRCSNTSMCTFRDFSFLRCSSPRLQESRSFPSPAEDRRSWSRIDCWRILTLLLSSSSDSSTAWRPVAAFLSYFAFALTIVDEDS